MPRCFREFSWQMQMKESTYDASGEDKYCHLFGQGCSSHLLGHKGKKPEMKHLQNIKIKRQKASQQL